MTQKDYTPEGIALRKAALKTKLAEKRDVLAKTANSLLRPDPATTRAEQFAATFSRAITIADGALLGYKLIRRFGWLIPSRKKKKRHRAL